MKESSEEYVVSLVEGCRKDNRASQKELYQHFFGFSMSICLRYTSNADEAQEILNDGFMKVFTKIDTYNAERPFIFWLRRIMINTSIDYYRKQPRNTYSIEIDEVRTLSSSQADAIEEINEKDLLKLVQSLPPAYRTVFNLYVLEGFKHEEIAKKLNIHVGTSKSNLAKARKHLQNKLKKLEKIKQ